MWKKIGVEKTWINDFGGSEKHGKMSVWKKA
jgi:hypothetical protein